MPVNPSYLERLLGDRIPVRGVLTINAAVAMDAVDEALGSIEHTIATAENLKRELSFFRGIAEALASPSAKVCA